MSEEQRILRIEERMDGLDDKLETIREGVQSIQISLAGKKDCPAPGSCVALALRMEVVEKKVGGLHDWHQQAIGIQQGAKAVWAVIGGAVTIGIVWLFNFFTTFGNPNK